MLNVESTDNTDTSVLVSTDADENEGPILKLDRNSSSPANSDITEEYRLQLEMLRMKVLRLSAIETRITDITDGSRKIYRFSVRNNSEWYARSIECKLAKSCIIMKEELILTFV